MTSEIGTVEIRGGGGCLFTPVMGIAVNEVIAEALRIARALHIPVDVKFDRIRLVICEHEDEAKVYENFGKISV